MILVDYLNVFLLRLIPRWLLQQCISEEVAREGGEEIAFQCLAICSGIDRSATWLYRWLLAPRAPLDKSYWWDAR